MNDLRASSATESDRPARFGLRVWARNSPWLMMAVLLHVLAVAIMSVIFLGTRRVETSAPGTEVALAPPVAPAPPDVEPPPVLVRDPLPAPVPEALAGPVNPDDFVVFDAAPGRPGERTDELDASLDPGHFNPDPAALMDLPSGAPGGTPHGVGKVGHPGTGRPSPFSGRVPGGGGPGGGGVGQAGEGGPGGDSKPQKSVFSALDWLARHQSDDGAWDCEGFELRCNGSPCSGPGSSAHDVGVTGLALLCFLGAGHTHAEGDYRGTVKKGLQWLMSVQDEQGCFGARVGQAFLYDHACAALAMTEAFGMTQAKPFKDPAQRGIQFVLRSANPYGAWRYASPADGDNDTSVTGWMVMALKSAKMSGLTIDELAIENALTWIDQMTDANGRTGYLTPGGPPSRLTPLLERFPPANSESMTAVGLLLRIFGGRTARADPMIEKSAELLAAKPPRWSDAGHVDFYYWYYGTLAMFQVGGARWERWNEAMQGAILEHQRADEDECAWGSWDPVDPWSSSGGRVYATALNCLSMEVYYRYPRVFGAKTR